ncbi:MAG: two-component system response regulatory protein [Parcubacteria group bacterium Athens0714_24]|nr:MAG: two-component system response regulatory protein [Parcubacteria group bacterium Athens0714_24]
MNGENSKKVLIIDDDEFLLDMYSTKFKESGIGVEISLSAQEALEKIRAGLNPSVVLLDIIMQGMDGFGFLETVKKESLLKDSKIIILSNLGQKGDIEKGLALGAYSYLVKAYYTPSEIVKKAKELL